MSTDHKLQTRKGDGCRTRRHSVLMPSFFTIACGMLFFCSSIGMAQSRELLCKYYSCSYSAASSPAYVTTFAASSEAQTVVDDILNTVAGMARGFEVREASILDNAAAAICDDQRYIFYNQNFIQSIIRGTGSYWSAVSIMAHEIGHHYHGHTLDDRGSYPKVELEADHFSGFVLQKMDATLQEARAAMKIVADPSGSDTHPGRESRLAAIEEGWFKSCNSNPNCDTGNQRDAGQRCEDYQYGREEFVACNSNTDRGYYWKLLNKVAHYSIGGVTAEGAIPYCGRKTVGQTGMSARWPLRENGFRPVRERQRNSHTQMTHPTCSYEGPSGIRKVNKDLNAICGIFLFECARQPR